MGHQVTNVEEHTQDERAPVPEKQEIVSIATIIEQLPQLLPALRAHSSLLCF